MSQKIISQIIVGLVLFLFVGTSILPSISGSNSDNSELSSLVFYTFDKTGTKKCKIELPTDIVKEISCLFEGLKKGITSDPFSAETESIKNDFVEILDKYNVIPRGLSNDDVISLLNPGWNRWCKDNNPFSKSDVLPAQYSHRGSAFLCSIAGGGGGMMFPPIMLPRPRLATVWAAYNYYAGSVASNLYTGHGFAALGPQFGTALGFWGIGLSFAVPGEPAIFGFGGYALAAWVMAGYVENYPPNRPPDISDEIPLDGSVDVSLSLSELSFRIGDGDGDRMSYTVTTNPDIGSGSGSNVVGGVYSIPVIGLNSDTEYSWHVVVSDAEDVSEETFSFRTAKEAPYVSDPSPVDGDDWVSVNISEISFRLEDFQGDLMDFSVETVPDIGSGSGSGVGDGVYTISVSDLEYTRDYIWYINVTDGEHWTRRIFGFKTRPKLVYDPFDEGWDYRKKMIVDHSQVAGDLSDFPLIVNIIDSDLQDKAQPDGDDILFMDGSGVANRLFHEVEKYDNSNGELVSWVNIPSLYSSEDTVFYLYYGNPGCSSQEYPDKVWDSDYQAVWHLSEDGSGLRYDSTSNHNDGTPYNYEGDEAVLGKIDGADDFDGNNDHIRTGVSFDYNYRTISFWINTDVKPPSDPNAILSQNANTLKYGQIYANIQSDGLHAKAGGEGSGGEFIFDISLNTWYMVQLIRDNQQTKYYVNGNLIDTGNSGNTGSTHGANPNLIIGSSRYYDRLFDGIADEVRVSDIVRSSDWISTEYNNQNNPLDFYIIGPEESSP